MSCRFDVHACSIRAVAVHAGRPSGDRTRIYGDLTGFPLKHPGYAWAGRKRSSGTVPKRASRVIGYVSRPVSGTVQTNNEEYSPTGCRLLESFEPSSGQQNARIIGDVECRSVGVCRSFIVP